MNIIDYVLSIPKSIDFYVYAVGSGGEFFTSLIALAHKETREILDTQYFDAIKTEDNLTRFYRAKYFEKNTSYNFLNLKTESNIFNSIDLFYFFGSYMEPEDKINYTKLMIFHSLLEPHSRIGSAGFLGIKNKEATDIKLKYRNTHIVMCTHWLDMGVVKNDKNFQNRNYGLKLFEEQKYWDVINLDPQTEKGINLVQNFCKNFGIIRNSDYKVLNHINHKSFKDIKLKFPFMDYLANNDFNSIKDYLENRYGSDLDFDFIDKALNNYKKLRVDPYL
jgi:hypothetical protein